MESIKDTLNELSVHFHATMNEFQKELKGSIPATSPSLNINSQFSAFRSFVMTVLENLQKQVELLSRQYDELEMRSRKKMILLHGVPETDKEDAAACVSKLLADHLNIPEIGPESFSRCHRLGRTGSERPRAFAVKFKDFSLRNKVWLAKTDLKGTGVTMSEFLTKCRHKTFLAARQRFGVSKCWTRDGVIIVLGSDGSKHRVVTTAELDMIPNSVSAPSVISTKSTEARDAKTTKIVNPRTKRIIKK